MLIGLTAPLEAGKKIQVTLNFEKAGAQTIDVPVKAMAGCNRELLLITLETRRTRRFRKQDRTLRLTGTAALDSIFIELSRRAGRSTMNKHSCSVS